eukprot:CAMPEP_0203910884 /NCGR_PEP_ID=MMETSP0359-20131031/52120_1 /ASSEMBLY_ACC=CAM_ASM_000338 /TAXON_ID=268821 /ORGANISM="Scrippsiella Hangoei, Strain SHTV-5" /LENGTH=38 /DNA_ID= /DNA_START= /DNA_END= /DNA_ORIENTATION=
MSDELRPCIRLRVCNGSKIKNQAALSSLNIVSTLEHNV